MKNKNDFSVCPFCNLSDISSRLVCQWNGAYVISDAHPITLGHLLVVSRVHHLSFGAMDIRALTSLKQKIMGISKILMSIKPKIILFEHGNQTMNKSGKPSVDHAHFHLLPTEDLRSYLPASKKRATFLDLPSYVTKCSYYFYWDVLGDMAYWGNATEIEPQFIRKIIASESGLIDWNWRNDFSINHSAKIQSGIIKSLLERS